VHTIGKLGLVILGLLVPCGGPLRATQDDPDPDLVRKVGETLASGKSDAAARVLQLRKAVAAEFKDEADRDTRLARILQDLTARAPLRVPISEMLTLENVRIDSYSGGRVQLKWPQGEVEYPLELLPEDTRSILLSGILSKAMPRDVFEVGKLLVRGKDYDRAGRCFAAAGKRDPALAAIAPDLERVKRASRLFEGSFRAVGNTLNLRWGFSTASENADFVALKGTMGVRPVQGLEVDEERLALTAVKEIPFRDRIKLSALARETDGAAHLLGIRFIKPDGGEVIIYGALATTLKLFLVTKVEDGKATELLAPTVGAAGNRMTMDFNRGRFSFLVGDRNVWSGDEGGFVDVTALVGAVIVNRPGQPSRARAQFRDISLSGEVDPRWMVKKTAGLRDALMTELSKEYQTRNTAAAGGDAALSIDPALSDVDDAVRAAYREALGKIAAVRKSLLQEDFQAAQSSMEKLSLLHPNFVPAWYFQGALAEMGGEKRTAAVHYDHALALLPDFPEAICGRGRLHALRGEWEPVRALVARALELKSDLPDALLLQARLQWHDRNTDAVIESTRVAQHLAPQDADVRSRAQKLSNVARGPAWPKPHAQATAHYALRTDLPAPKAKGYADHLEAVRSLYEEVLGRPLPAQKPAEVLLFESDEGYYAYMDFTAGSRLENTLGAFSPDFGQMALYEGVDPSETLRVLSHEGFHQALHSVAPDVPIWFNEGMAEYVAASKVEKGKVLQSGGILTGRLENLKLAMKYGWQPLGFQRMMLEPQSEFYGADAPFQYAQAWSMIRFFLHGDDGKWKPLLRRYAARLLEGAAPLAAFEATFGQEDLPRLEAAWLGYYGLVVVPRRPDKAPAAPEAPPTDLLELLRTRGPLNPGWRLTGPVLESLPYNRTVLDLGAPPGAEYDWTFSLEKTSGDRGLILGLVGGGRSFVVVLDERRLYSVEAVEGPGDGQSRRPGPFLRLATRSIQCAVRATGVQLSVDGTVVLDWKGDFRKLSLSPTLPREAPQSHLFLYSIDNEFKITKMLVKGVSSGPAAAPPAEEPELTLPSFKPDPERFTALESPISAWIKDPENDRIFAADRITQQVLEFSTTERKVTRKIPLDGHPAALGMVPGSGKVLWVGTGGTTRNLYKIDLDTGAITDTIPISADPVSLAVGRKYLWYLARQKIVLMVDLTERKDAEQALGNSASIAYDLRHDRLWGRYWDQLTEWDTSKLGPAVRENRRKSLPQQERNEIGKVLSGKRHHSAVPVLGPSDSQTLLVDERSAKLFLGRTAVKADRPEAPLGTFTPKAPHSLAREPAVLAYAANYPGLEDILAVSPDGKWAASGTLLYRMSTLGVVRELPLPTALVAFSKDSKEIYYFDWVNKGVSSISVESK